MSFSVVVNLALVVLAKQSINVEPIKLVPTEQAETVEPTAVPADTNAETPAEAEQPTE